jgi:hypothetical protein
VLIQKQLSRTKKNGWLVAIGMALQKTREDFVSTYVDINSKRTIAVPALRFGYAFSSSPGRNAFIVEINGTGPHAGKIGPAPYYGQVIEILTQLSIGVRWRW